MWTFLIGHRGVGKTACLARIQALHARAGVPCLTLDLDEEIETREHLSIAEIFLSQGEAYFRRLEQEVLKKILIDHAGVTSRVFVAVGAGFQGAFPEGSRVAWIRRASDDVGRVFLNRPRLSAAVSPLEEFLTIRKERQPRYAAVADVEWTLPEGFFSGMFAWEELWLGLRQGDLGGLRTLMRRDVRRPKDFSSWLQARNGWGWGGLELRDDYFSAGELASLADACAAQKTPVLISLRVRSERPAWAPQIPNSRIDWALELGSAPLNFEPDIISCHTRGGTLAETLRGLPKAAGAHLKLAVEVQSFFELRQGHDWWLEDPAARSFLPASADGRWSWYRQLFGPKMRVAFWREAEGSSVDQPIMAEWLRTKIFWKNFAAVLGDPVLLSWTPAEQSPFFAERAMPVVAIKVRDGELAEALPVLRGLGLKAAAVTAPLKSAAWDLSGERSDTAIAVRAVNTLAWDPQREHWRGHNTDGEGLSALLSRIDLVNETVAVWGGGGTKSTLEAKLPQADFFSARATQAEIPNYHPSVLVWSVGRSRMGSAGAQWPPSRWTPHTVIDLNYSEDSPGREYALLTKARYISGESMFRTQAAAQRSFWDKYLG